MSYDAGYELHQRCALPPHCLMQAESAESSETLEIVIGHATLRLVATRTAQHSANNAACALSTGSGDCTGHRTSGGAARCLCYWLEGAAEAAATGGGGESQACAGQRQNLSGFDVLELGCGLGLAGLVAARHAAAVVLTDGDDAALALAKRCAALNAASLIAPLRFEPLAWGTLSPTTLTRLVTSPRPLLLLAADLLYYAAGTGLCVRRRSLPPGRSFQGIKLLLSDFLTHSWCVRSLLHRLLDSVASLAGHRPGSFALLASNPRYDGWRADVVRGCAARGLALRRLPPSAVVPPDALAAGWYGGTSLLMLWPEREAQPVVGAGGWAAFGEEEEAEGGGDGSGASADARGWAALSGAG